MRKNTFYMVVLLLAGAVMAACSGGDDMTSDITPEQQTPAENVVVELVGTLASKGNMTRGVDEYGNDRWEVGDQFVIYYETANGHSSAVATVENVRTYIDGSAEFRATLMSPKTGNNNVKLVYPASAYDGKGGFKPDALMNQDGTMDYINENNLDIQTALATMSVDGTNATLEGDVTMEPQVSLFILSLRQAGTNKLISTKKLEITNGAYKYTITPAEATQKFIIALLSVENSTFTFSCQSSSIEDAYADYTYVKDFVPANITTSDIGNVILPDNKVYSCSLGGLPYSGTFTATLEKGVWYYGDFYNGIFVDLNPSSVTTPVAMIAYVGNETGEGNTYNHGLAIAMKDANNGSCSWGGQGGVNYNTYQWDGSGAASSESGLQYRAARNNTDWPAFNYCASYSVEGYDPAEHGCSPWFLCSAYQWDTMLAASKDVKGVYFNNWQYRYDECFGLRDAFSTIRGGENIKDDSYWSCTERDDYGVYQYNFSDLNDWRYSGWYYGNYDKPGSGCYARSVFAF